MQDRIAGIIPPGKKLGFRMVLCVFCKNIRFGGVCNVTPANSPKIYTLLAFGAEMYLHFITAQDTRL